MVVVGGFVLGDFVCLGVLGVIVTVVLGFFRIFSCPSLVRYSLFMLDRENWHPFFFKESGGYHSWNPGMDQLVTLYVYMSLP